MYRYDQYDHQIVKERVAQYRDQVRRRLAGELTEDEFRPLRLQNGLYIQRHAHDAARRRALRPAVVAAGAHARAHRAQVRPRLRPLHHPPEHPVQLADAGRDARHPRRAGDGARCTRSRPAATASATSPPTTSPASPPTRSSTRGRMPRSCASGRPSTPSSPTCRASSRSRSTASIDDRAAIAVHDIGLHRACATTRARSASACSSAAAWAARRSSAA